MLSVVQTWLVLVAFSLLQLATPQDEGCDANTCASEQGIQISQKSDVENGFFSVRAPGRLFIEFRLRHAVGAALIVLAAVVLMSVVRFVRRKNSVVVEIGRLNRVTTGTPHIVAQVGHLTESGAKDTFWFLQSLRLFISGGGWPSGWILLVPSTQHESPAFKLDDDSASSALPGPPVVSAETLDRYKVLFCTQEYFGQSTRKNSSTIQIPQKALVKYFQTAFSEQLAAISDLCGGHGAKDNAAIFSPAQTQYLTDMPFEIWYLRCGKASDFDSIVSRCASPSKLAAKRIASTSIRFAAPVVNFQQHHHRLKPVASRNEGPNEEQDVASQLDESGSSDHTTPPAKPANDPQTLTLAAELDALSLNLQQHLFSMMGSPTMVQSKASSSLQEQAQEALEACVRHQHQLWAGQDIAVVVEGPVSRSPAYATTSTASTRTPTVSAGLDESKAGSGEERVATSALYEGPASDFVVVLPEEYAVRALNDALYLAEITEQCRPRIQGMFSRSHKPPFRTSAMRDAVRAIVQLDGQSTTPGDSLNVQPTAPDSELQCVRGDLVQTTLSFKPLSLLVNRVPEPRGFESSPLAPALAPAVAEASTTTATVTVANPSKYRLLYFMFSEDGSQLLSVTAGPGATVLKPSVGSRFENETDAGRVYMPTPLLLLRGVPRRSKLVNTSDPFKTPTKKPSDQNRLTNGGYEFDSVLIGSPIHSFWFRPPQNAEKAYLNLWVALMRSTYDSSMEGTETKSDHDLVEAYVLNECEHTAGGYLGRCTFQGPTLPGVHFLALVAQTSSAPSQSRGLFRFFKGHSNGSQRLGEYKILWRGPHFRARSPKIQLLGPPRRQQTQQQQSKSPSPQPTSVAHESSPMRGFVSFIERYSPLPLRCFGSRDPVWCAMEVCIRVVMSSTARSAL